MSAPAPSAFISSLERAHAQALRDAPADSEASAARRTAFHRFVVAGLPTARDENWKYLQLRSLARRELQLPMAGAAAVRLPEDVFALPNAVRLFFIDGHFSAPLSSPLPGAEGVRIEALKAAYAREPGLISTALPSDDRADTRFALLNTAFSVDGASIDIDGAELPLIYAVFIASGADGAAASFPRLRIRATRGARATVIEHHVARGGGSRFVNSLTQLEIESGAHVQLCRLHGLTSGALQFDTLRARVGNEAGFGLHSIAVGGDVVRSDIDVALDGAGAAADLHGLLFTAGTEHHELHAEIRHAAPRTTSRTHVRTVVNDTARAICNSKVTVARAASRSVSEQNFRNLLLAPAAEADTRPQLEIHNEDVKCSHGASTGRLDPNMLFYLTTRGLDAATARGLLTYAFVIDVLRALPVEQLGQVLAHRIAGALPARDLIKDFL